MKKEALIHFANVSTLDEPLFDSPMGSLSLKQIAIAGGGCVLIILAVLDTYTNSSYPELSYALLGLLPIPIYLGMFKKGVLTMDMYLLSLITFKINGGRSTKKIKNQKITTTDGKVKQSAKPKSMKVRSKTKAISKIESKEVVRKFTVSRPGVTTRALFTLVTTGGEPLKNTHVRVFLDNEMIYKYTTDPNGQITAPIVVKDLGKRKLVIKADNFSAPIMTGTLEFVLEKQSANPYDDV